MNAKVKALPDGMTLRQYYAAVALPESIREMNAAESYDCMEAAQLAFAYAV